MSVSQKNLLFFFWDPSFVKLGSDLLVERQWINEICDGTDFKAHHQHLLSLSSLSLSLSHTHTHTLSHSHSYTHSYIHTYTYFQSLSHIHIHTLILCLPLSLSLSHTHTRTEFLLFTSFSIYPWSYLHYDTPYKWGQQTWYMLESKAHCHWFVDW